jgi:hypothetical protein
LSAGKQTPPVNYEIFKAEGKAQTRMPGCRLKRAGLNVAAVGLGRVQSINKSD